MFGLGRSLEPRYPWDNTVTLGITMAWRRDYIEAFCIDRAHRGLSGVPDPGELESPATDLEPNEVVLVLRDRLGFRYERIVGLDDYVSQRDASLLLGLPVMTVNRWVGKRLKGKRRGEFTVVRLRDVLAVAKEDGRKLTFKARLVVEGTDQTERTWIPTR